jgi:serine/threonine-protein kinase
MTHVKTTIKSCTYCQSPYDTASTHVCVEAPADSNVAASLRPQIGLVIDRKYRLESRLGEGGMGQVFRARRLFMDDFVAVKFMRPEVLANPETRQRFYQEARAAARIKHPHVVTVHDFGETPDGLVYLVMEFLEGSSLGELLKKTGPLALDRVIEIGMQICQALTCMHENNVIHRDLKPDNIMMVQDGEGGEMAKVVDFGVAKILESDTRMTRYQVRIGSPIYCSPEQYVGQPVDHRTDLYGLGMIFYECLSGQVPFETLNETELRAAILNQMPPRLDEKINGVTGHFADFVQWLLAKNPDERPRHAAEVSKSLQMLRRTRKLRAAVSGRQPAASARAAGPANGAKGNSPTMLLQKELASVKTRRSQPKHRYWGKVTAIGAFAIAASLLSWKIVSDPAVSKSLMQLWAQASNSMMIGKSSRRGTIATRLPAPADTSASARVALVSAPEENGAAPKTPILRQPTAPVESFGAAAKNGASNFAPNSLSTRPEKPAASNLDSPARKSFGAVERVVKPDMNGAATRLVADRRLPAATLAPLKKSAPVLPSPSAGMILIKETEFMFGDLFGDGNINEKPAHRVRVAAFWIGQHEVTNREYLAFVKATGAHLPEWMQPGSKFHYQTGSDGSYKNLGPALYGLDNPVVGVSWQDAVKYCDEISFADRSGMGAGGARRQQRGQIQLGQWRTAARAGRQCR